MNQDISTRFEENLGRVQSLLGLYEEGHDREPGGHAADLLRAAVVFLHATLEDLVRSLLEWKLPTAPAESLEDIALPGFRARSRFSLGDLVTYRGRTVDDVVHEAVTGHLLESNFNHPGELARALSKIGLVAAVLDPYRHHLGALMKRRHWIVHRADRSEEQGVPPQAIRSLARDTVEDWLAAVRGFGGDVLEAT